MIHGWKMGVQGGITAHSRVERLYFNWLLTSTFSFIKTFTILTLILIPSGCANPSKFQLVQ